MGLVMRASENLRQHGAMRDLRFHFLANESEGAYKPYWQEYNDG